jgi:hypothetical protein
MQSGITTMVALFDLSQAICLGNNEAIFDSALRYLRGAPAEVTWRVM